MTGLCRAALLGCVAAFQGVAPALGAGPPTRGASVAGVSPLIRAAEDAGRVDPELPLERMVVVLPVKDPAGLERFLGELQNPGSSRFRKWLTPSEFGTRFGARKEDLETMAAWLRSEGFAVEGATAGQTALLFSGRAADVERAFGTELHVYLKDGTSRVANARPMTLPASYAGGAIPRLLPIAGFERRPPLVREASPLYTVGSTHYLAPADFATIYRLDALPSPARGAGRKIGIVARTNVDPADLGAFRAVFGLPPREPVIVVNGEDPGVRYGSNDLVETHLDAEWSGGLAPEADVIVVVSKSTATTDGIDLSCLHAVDQNLADVLNVSYGTCEQNMAPEEVVFYTNLWAQAAAQGISVVVSSGDAGAAGCERWYANLGTGPAVNGLGSSPYVTAAGGTQFDTGANGSLYWSDTNDPVTWRSALGPIPEVAWNQSGLVPGGSGLLAGGGGASILYERPAWQSLPGTPSGGRRLVPDISVAASGLSQYLMVSGRRLVTVFGTSAAAPAVAGIAALLHEAAGERLGSLNTNLYALGQRQYADGTVSVFRDVTSGSNSVPGVAGFEAGPGYDPVTGLGSPDVAALAAAIRAAARPAPTADFTFSPGPMAGEPVPFTDTSTGSPTSWSWDFGDGGTSAERNPVHTFGAGTYSVSLTASNDNGSSTRSQSVVVSWGGPVACAADAFTMCLMNSRYRVTSRWKNQYSGGAEATLRSSPLTDTTGAFWFSDPATYEYLIRVTVGDNGRAWIAIPTFTDVEFRIAVLDATSGQYKEYRSPPGNRSLIYDPYFFVYP